MALPRSSAHSAASVSSWATRRPGTGLVEGGETRGDDFVAVNDDEVVRYGGHAIPALLHRYFSWFRPVTLEPSARPQEEP